MAERLQAQGFRAAPIHGDLSQNRREHAMQNFRSGHIELLVATDVAARGIDVPKVGHIINYDVPQDPLTYFHRIGRTARAGRAGKAISLVSNSEYPDFSRIAGMTQVEIKRVTDVLPAGYRPPPVDTSFQYSSRGGRRFQGERRRPSFRRDDAENRDSRPQGGRPGGFSFTERTAAGGFSGNRDRPGFSHERPRDSRDFGRRTRRPNYRR